MCLRLTPGTVTLADLATIYFAAKAARLDPESRAAVEASAAHVDAAVAAGVPVYGVNTGFGKLASVRISKSDTIDLQRNLVLSHCAGVGEPLGSDVVRLVMVLKLISLGRGASGVRWKVIEQIEAMLDADLLPVVPAQGSVGASGDLAPLSHIAAALIGEGECICNGERMPSAAGLNRVGIQPIILGAKEGLALINGTQVSTALALAGLFKAWRTALTSLVTGALSTDAAMGSAAPFHHEIHALRGQPGQIDAARSLDHLLAGLCYSREPPSRR